MHAPTRFDRPFLKYSAIGMKDCELVGKHISPLLTRALDAQIKVFQAWFHCSRSQAMDLVLYPAKPVTI